MNSLEKQLDSVATSLVMLDPGNMPSLASLHDIFETLRDSFKTDHLPLSSVAQKCADLIEQLIMREVPDVTSALSSVSDAIVGLQAVIRDGRELSSTSFPEHLKPELSTDSKSPSSKKQLKASQSLNSSNSATPPKSASSDISSNSEQSKNRAPIVHKEIGDLTMQFQGADTSLIAEFINEARDHCLTAEQKMMDIETGADYDATINAIFRGFHTIKGAAGFLELRPISALSHESETLLDLVRKGTMSIEGRTADVIFSAIDGLRKLLSAAEEGLKTGGSVDGTAIVKPLVAELQGIISGSDGPIENPTPGRVGDILVDMGVTTQDAINGAMANKQQPGERIGETLVKQGVVDAKAVAHALKDQRMAQRESAPVQTAVKEIVKIDTERLDKLVDTIGELVIAESMVGHDEEFLALVPPRIAKNVSHLNKITRELQEMGMAMRLVPVRATFQKLARAVRDLTRKSGKKIELLMSGEDVEVDRSVVEHIGDPLMHMIRNSVDHAVETPDERVANGKSETGHVWLRAYHRGGNIHFEIEDDGRGLDSERILAKAREKNLLDRTRELTEREIFNLILLPGFSTAKQVTDISGRGVGMDVVKKNLDAMRGHLEIESVRQQGTKFTMKLPLTMAMIDGMLIRVGTERYIVPTLSVIESLNLEAERIFTVRGRQEMINLRGSMLPIVRLSQAFGLSTGHNDGDRIVVVVEDNESRIGLVAEELIGQRQTVIKNLGPLFSRQKWVSGGAILSDGTVGLILDVSGLIHLANGIEGGDAGNSVVTPQPILSDNNLDIENMETSEADDPVAELQLN